MNHFTTYEHQASTCPPQADPLRHTIYDIRYTSYANRRNTPNSAATPNKPPIQPNLSTNYDLIMQNKPNLPDAQMNVNKVLTKDYENETAFGLWENKPNQSQFQTANLLVNRMVKSQQHSIDIDKWHPKKGGSTYYAMRWIPSLGRRRYHSLYMHRQVIAIPYGMFPDHINHNGLDNRKANLRPATRAQNSYNRKKYANNSYSKYKGVSWKKKDKKWTAQISLNNKMKFLGYFQKEIDDAQGRSLSAPGGTQPRGNITGSLRQRILSAKGVEQQDYDH